LLLIAILNRHYFETWKRKLNSKLEENEELKSILLAETPWINDAKADKTKLALLFDLENERCSRSYFQ
jgi:hypothetical protein